MDLQKSYEYFPEATIIVLRQNSHRHAGCRFFSWPRRGLHACRFSRSGEASGRHLFCRPENAGAVIVPSSGRYSLFYPCFSLLRCRIAAMVAVGARRAACLSYAHGCPQHAQFNVRDRPGLACLTSTAAHDGSLVVISVAIAIFASFMALQVAGMARDSDCGCSARRPSSRAPLRSAAASGRCISSACWRSTCAPTSRSSPV